MKWAKVRNPEDQKEDCCRIDEIKSLRVVGWKQIERFDLHFGSRKGKTYQCGKVEGKKSRVSHTFEIRNNSDSYSLISKSERLNCFFWLLVFKGLYWRMSSQWVEWSLLKRYAHIPILGICECYLVWERGICQCN